MFGPLSLGSCFRSNTPSVNALGTLDATYSPTFTADFGVGINGTLAATYQPTFTAQFASGLNGNLDATYSPTFTADFESGLVGEMDATYSPTFTADFTGTVGEVITLSNPVYTPASDEAGASLTVDISYGGADELDAVAAFGGASLAATVAQIVAKSGGTDVNEYAADVVQLGSTSGTVAVSFTDEFTASADGSVRLALGVKERTDPGESNVLIITVSNVDYSAATLSAPTGTQTGATTADGGVTSNEADGAIYAGVRPAASSVLTADQLIAGAGGAGVAWDSDTTPTADANNAVSFTGLTASTDYQVDYVMLKHGIRSAVVSSATFTTAAGASGPSATLIDAPTDHNTVGTAITVDLSSVSEGDQLYIGVAKAGGGQTATLTGLTLEGSAATLLDESSQTVSRSKMYFYEITCPAAAAGNAVAEIDVTSGSAPSYSVAVVKATGTITTETTAGNEYVDTTDPLVGDVNTGTGFVFSGAVKEDTADFTWAGNTEVAGFSPSARRIEWALQATTVTETPRTITATHGSALANDHAAIMSLAVT